MIYKKQNIFNNIYLRNITENDLELIFKWANEEDVRQNSFNKENINYEEHKKWFLKKIKNKDMFYLLQHNENKIGQIRVDKIDDGLLISYSIDREKRGKGYGRIIVELLEKELLKNKIDEKIIAYVKKSNIASVKIFIDLGYEYDIENNIYCFYKKLDTIF